MGYYDVGLYNSYGRFVGIFCVHLQGMLIPKKKGVFTLNQNVCVSLPVNITTLTVMTLFSYIVYLTELRMLVTL